MISLFTLYCCLSLLLLTLVSMWFTPYLRAWNIKRICKQQENDYTTAGDNPISPAVSIIIPIVGQPDVLQKSLPLFLQQDYSNGVQLIVVIEKGDYATENILQQYEQDSRVYVTYIPESSRYMSRKKLAITIGVKAAKTDWVFITDPTNMPKDEHWLSHFATYLRADVDLVVPYSNFEDCHNVRRRFARLKLFCYQFLQIIGKGNPYHSVGTCVALRKGIFMSGSGFLGNLHLLRGEYHFLINKFAKKGRSVQALIPQCHLVEENPDSKTMLHRELFYKDTSKNLEHKHLRKTGYILDSLFYYLTILAQLSCALLGFYIHNYVVLTISTLLFFLLFISRLLLRIRICNVLQEKIPVYAIPLVDFSLLWTEVYSTIRYLFADKYDFTSHKL